MQETVLLALRLENTFILGTNIRAWLFTLMKNTYLNESRKRRRRGQLSIEEQPSEYTIDCANRQESRLALTQAMRAVDRLSPVYKEVLVLVALRGLSYADTARIIGKPLGTVRSRLARGRKMLKDALEE